MFILERDLFHSNLEYEVKCDSLDTFEVSWDFFAWILNLIYFFNLSLFKFILDYECELEVDVDKSMISKCYNEELMMIMCKAIFNFYDDVYNIKPKQIKKCFGIMRSMLYNKSKKCSKS